MTGDTGRVYQGIGLAYLHVGNDSGYGRGTAPPINPIAPAGLEQLFFEVGVPLAEGATTALPPTKEEIEKLMANAPRYGVESVTALVWRVGKLRSG